MKKLIFGLILLALSAASMARDGYAVRYSTSYSTWDRTFSTHYTYRETVHTSCGYYTCYEDYSSASRVYVEETIVERGDFRGYTRVNVYRDRGYSNRYVTYYTHNGRVVSREYRRPHRVVRHRVYRHHRYSTVNYVYLDEFTAKIILGMEFVELGATVMGACNPDSDGFEACMALGAASSVSGSLISISASMEEEERTELQRRIESENKMMDDADIEESMDEDIIE